MTFRTRLAAGFGLVLLVVVVVGAVGYRSTYRMSAEEDKMVANAKKQNMAMEMEWALASESDDLRGYLLTGDAALVTEFNARAQHLTESATEVKGMLVTARGKALLPQIEGQHQLNLDAYRKAIEMRRAGKSEEAMRLVFSPELNGRRTQMMKDMQELDDLTDQLMAEAIAGHDEAEVQTRAMMLIFGLLGIAGGVICAGLVTRSITRPVCAVGEALKAIDAGELNFADLAVGSEDELGDAARALNSMKNNLREVVGSMADAAEALSVASGDISVNASEGVKGAETEKGQVQQIATAMQEMSATIHEISEGTNQATESARRASENARSGGTIVDNMRERMQGISRAVHEASGKVAELGQRSDEIGKIVAVIDDIANQTNLLALNAAIEAARAGEQGRGFAVVAGEVRRLAERTANATREITGMIEGVQTETRTVVETMHAGTEEVEHGVEITVKAGESLQQIIGDAENVGQMISQIATATTEQSATTEDVTMSVTRINQLVTGSAEEAQKTARSCDRLTGLAEELRKMVGRFHIAEGGRDRGRDARATERSGAVRPQLTSPAM
ncbi:MAG TPA: methyl-accepting chemotaxis protein [Acidobacteriaceae bacterium]|nr:methyl-accepting chemotaxis protein [Acidobacteriaceae bacterium]